jgi:hypothetical protein
VAYDPDLDLFIGVANAVIETRGADIDVIRSGLVAVLEAGDGIRRRLPRVEDEEGRAWSVGEDGVVVSSGIAGKASPNSGV